MCSCDDGVLKLGDLGAVDPPLLGAVCSGDGGSANPVQFAALIPVFVAIGVGDCGAVISMTLAVLIPELGAVRAGVRGSVIAVEFAVLVPGFGAVGAGDRGAVVAVQFPCRESPFLGAARGGGLGGLVAGERVEPGWFGAVLFAERSVATACGFSGLCLVVPDRHAWCECGSVLGLSGDVASRFRRMDVGMSVSSVRSRTFGFSRTAGAASGDGSVFVRRSAMFAAEAFGDVQPSLLSVMTGDGLRSFYSSADPARAKSSAVALAQAMGARAEEASVPGVVADVEFVGWLEFDNSLGVVRETQVGADLGVIAQGLAMTLREGQWVGASLRRPSSRERKRHQRWLGPRLAGSGATHHTLGQSPGVFSLYAGADSPDEVDRLLGWMMSALPGFDVPSTTTVWSRRRAVWRGPLWLAASAVLVAVGLSVLVWGPGLVGRLVPGLPWWLPVFPLGLAAAGLLWGGVRAAGLVGSWWSRLVSGLQVGLLPGPAAKRGRVRRPRAAVRLEDGSMSEPMEGDYPLAGSAFLLGPQVVVPLVTPAAGAVSGVESTAVRPVPGQLRARVGQLVGDVGGDVFLPADAGRWCVFTMGAPGTGKTAFTHAAFGWHVCEMVSPSGLPGAPGRSNTIVAFESKDASGVDDYRVWAAACGSRVRVVEVAGGPGSGPAIDLFGSDGGPAERADAFVNAMVYAFGDGAIQDRSFLALKQVFTAALAVPADVVARVPGLAGSSPMRLASVLLGSVSDKTASDFYAQMKRAHSEAASLADPDPDRLAALGVAVESLASLFEGRTESSRRNMLDAPLNKVDQLAALGSWWSLDRERVSWREVLSAHVPVVVNLGPATDGGYIQDRSKQVVASMLMFTLRAEIERSCSGWADRDRWVTVLSDELSLLAGHSPEVFTWLRDQGRSFGVRLFVATQRAEQLDQRTRTVMLNSGTVIAFRQDDVNTAREVASQFTPKGDEWTANDVVQLPAHHAIVRTWMGSRLAPFTCLVSYFDDDPSVFPAAQGYQVAALPVPVRSRPVGVPGAAGVDGGAWGGSDPVNPDPMGPDLVVSGPVVSGAAGVDAALLPPSEWTLEEDDPWAGLPPMEPDTSTTSDGVASDGATGGVAGGGGLDDSWWGRGA